MTLFQEGKKRGGKKRGGEGEGKRKEEGGKTNNVFFR